ncbi:MAG TPA: hypothetical protein RMH85_33250 [Polyangiaceae bacterium LLY-WYZ-15_(1-7)]|nr:hypothetical protein [Sandaracinus sp.]MBJ70570.1 hypothetical protein [Sandaracinus sp.]HJL01906.1 hypothetical protein [Polyangiaceae bacterium LLY-WYZ-15_(1-7)]HJL13397.1 hypothetical protein [Polyangiaceae bacterium LLY-WYZ-15_(1-7)]
MRRVGRLLPFLLLLLLPLASACGGVPDLPTYEAEPTPPLARCGLSCETPPLRSLAAHVEGDALQLAARGLREPTLLRARAGAPWDPEAIRFAPAGPAGGRPWRFLATPGGPGLLHGGGPGDAGEAASLRWQPAGDAPPRALAGGPLRAVDAALVDGVPWVAWVDGAGRLKVRALEGEGPGQAVDPRFGAAEAVAVALATHGRRVFAARASDRGVELAELGPGAEAPPPMRLSAAPSRAVALAPLGRGLAVAWTERLAVRWARVGPTGEVEAGLLDDGRRSGEGARRVGAALRARAVGDGVLFAYQDQSRGRLVLARLGASGPPVREEHATEGWVRAMDVALLDGRAIDLGLRRGPDGGFEARLFVTRAGP